MIGFVETRVLLPTEGGYKRKDKRVYEQEECKKKNASSASILFIKYVSLCFLNKGPAGSFIACITVKDVSDL